MAHILHSGVGKWRRRLATLGTASILTLALAMPGQGQGNDLASMQVRLDQMEEQVRIYSGQIEGLQFQMTQLQTLLERMQEDNEFRFGQLEGGSLGENKAATSAGGVTPSQQLSPENQQTPNSSLPDTVIDPLADELIGDEDITDGEPMGDDSNLFASQVFGAGSQLGAPEGPLGSTLPSAPLDLSFDASKTPLENGDANAQYQAGYDAIVRGEYAFAEMQFTQFLEQYPDNAQAPDATYWLGDVLLRRGEHDQAAELMLTGFERYAATARGADLLLKLGVALHGAGEFDTACRTFGEVLRRYPDSTQVFKDRVMSEQANAGC